MDFALPDTYLEKAQKAEEAGLKSRNPEMREGWLEVARSYRLLASRQIQRPSSNGKADPPKEKANKSPD